MDKRRSHSDFPADVCDKSRRAASDELCPVQEHLEEEKRSRREIANSNERRRMQSINSGFDSLRILLPPMQDGEKMSKATILQLTAEYIHTLVEKINSLENEVAAYRQSNGLPPPVAKEFPPEHVLPRKRKPSDMRKRSGIVRPRKRRIDEDPQFDCIRSCVPHTSLSADTIQTSPSNSFNSSLSTSPPSSLPDGTSSSARLEHLVMAIEQIEGGRALNCSDDASPEGSLSIGDRSPALSTEPYWQSPGFVFPDGQPSNLKSDTFTEMLMLTPLTNIPSVSTPMLETSCISETTDQPVIAKPNRPIPHKYLHRPQVVVNSSH